MKTRYVKASKVVSLLAAGKLITSAHAADTGTKASPGSKGSQDPATRPTPRLTLNQIGKPFDLIAPPTEGMFGVKPPPPPESTDTMMDPSMATDGMYEDDLMGSKNDTQEATTAQMLPQTRVGHIYTDMIPKPDPNTGALPEGVPHPRIDFIIGNIRNDIPMDIYLAYSTTPPPPGETMIPVGMNSSGGQIALNLSDLGIIALATVQPVVRTGFPNAVGKVSPNATRSVTIPVDLSALNDPALMTSNEIFFQAAAVPSGGELDFSRGQATEVDRFIIERNTDGQLGGAGSKGGDDGSKYTNDASIKPEAETGSKGTVINDASTGTKSSSSTSTSTNTSPL